MCHDVFTKTREQPTGHSGLTSKAEEEGFKVSRFYFFFNFFRYYSLVVTIKSNIYSSHTSTNSFVILFVDVCSGSCVFRVGWLEIKNCFFSLRVDMVFRSVLTVTVLLLGVYLLVDAHGDDDHHYHDHSQDDDADDETPTAKTADSDLPKLNPEEVEYHKGSLCGYCEYCKVVIPTLGKY